MKDMMKKVALPILVTCSMLSTTLVEAATRTDRFTNSAAVDTIYLWAEEGAAGDILDFLSVSFPASNGGNANSMASWVVDISSDQNSVVLYGNQINAGSGLFDIQYWYQNGTRPTFEYATGVWTTPTTFSVRSSGEIERRGRRWQPTGSAFSHSADIVNPRAPAAVVPIPSAVVLLMSALSFLMIKSGLPPRLFAPAAKAA